MNLSQIAPAPTGAMDAEERTFWGEVEKFKSKADEAVSLWQRLRAKRQAAASNPALQAEYNDVMGEAENITAKISDVERVTNAVSSGVAETIKSWLPDWSLSGFYQEQRADGHLGFLPVLAVGLVAAAIAWLGSWIVKGNIIDRKLSAVENLIAGGVSPAQAGALIEEKGDPGPFAALFGNIGTGIAVAGIGAMLLYFFMEKKRGF